MNWPMASGLTAECGKPSYALLINHTSNSIYYIGNTLIKILLMSVFLLLCVVLPVLPVQTCTFCLESFQENRFPTGFSSHLFTDLIVSVCFWILAVRVYRQPANGRQPQRRRRAGGRVCSSAAALWRRRRRERASAALSAWCWPAERGPGPAWALRCSGTADILA